jgi:hypothetical protein
MASTAIDLFDLADQISMFSSAILEYRVNNPTTRANALALVQVERQLDELVNSLRNRGIVELGQQLAPQQGRIGAAISDAKTELAKIEKVKKAIDIATSVIGIAQSLLTMNFAQAIQQSIALSTDLADQG